MKPRNRKSPRPFQLQLRYYANGYYIERIARLEAVLDRRPRTLQIDLIGVGEIPADMALLIRSVLMGRAARTRLVTCARSSLSGGSVLVWLLGDHRIIRDDARVFFRRAQVPEGNEARADELWKAGEAKFTDDDSSDLDPEEGDYARLLQLIDDYLPVKELAGRLIRVPVLRQFGLVENERVDQFLATAFGRADEVVNEPEKKCIRAAAKAPQPRALKK